ncbi:MAG: DnaJ domain-containing protein, partial [Candidatus Methylomirabilis sp.]|nr:DnaJ domain-containing protein [Deltaproteobacteria bacterium]
MNDRHYRTLGLDPGATPAQVKRAYRMLARSYHPDLRPGDKAAEARFRDVSLAYEVLSES